MFQLILTGLFYMLLSYNSIGQVSSSVIPGNLELLNSNVLTNTISVHTFKRSDTASNGVQDDGVGNTPVSVDIQNIIQAFTNIPGVSRCTYDQATATFTVVSTPSVQFDQPTIIND
jgi:hypothetical protein